MGLDMYLYKIKKIEDASRYNGRAEEDIPFTVFNISENDPDFEPLFGQIADYLYPVSIDVEEFDEEKFTADFGIEPDDYQVSFCYGFDGAEFGYNSGKIIKLEPSEYIAYFRRVIRERLIADLDEVAYWRKEYDLQEDIHEACGVQIENCGYYPLNDDMWEAIQRHDPDQYNNVYLWNEGDSVIVYHEWY